VSLSVAVLFAALVSFEPAPAVTVAVLLIVPVALGSTMPLIVSVRLLPAPAPMLAPVNDTLLPAVAFVPHAAVPAVAQLTLTPVIVAGTASAIERPVASDGPALVTVMV
jgi:hypothetical protein